MNKRSDVPKALQNWFKIHFVLDVFFALPLFLFPEKVLFLFGWQQVDPITARMVSAALFGIGIESLLIGKGTIDSYLSMLNLKILWSFSAILGLSWALISGAQNRPPFLWVIWGIFLCFNVLWIFWRQRLKEFTNV